MAQTSPNYDHLIIWPSSVTLTFNLSEQIFQMALLLLKEIILKSMHKCRSYGPDKLNLWSFYQLTFRCDFDLQSTWTNVSNGTATRQGEQLCQIIVKFWNLCINVGLWPGQVHFMTILSLDLQMWPWPSTYLKNCFKWPVALLKDNNCVKLLWNSCKYVEVMARTSSIFDILSFDL